MNNYSPIVVEALKLMDKEGVMYRIEHKKGSEQYHFFYTFDPNEEFYWNCAFPVAHNKSYLPKAVEYYTEYYKEKLNWSDDDLQVLEHNGGYYFKRNLLHLSQSLCGEGLEGIIYWFMATSNRKSFNNFACKNFGAPVKSTNGSLLFTVYRSSLTEDYEYHAPTYNPKKLWYPSTKLFETGFVVRIEGQNYEVKWPGFDSLEYAPWDRPDLVNSLVMTPTKKPITKPSEKGEFYVWGKGFCQQSSPKAIFNKKEAF